MNTKAMFSSKTDLWATPQAFFNQMDDTCAIPENAKCKRFFSSQIDGLSQDWGGSIAWCNPPYGREIGKWVRKAAESKALVVMLLPARTDTAWFHDFIYHKAEIRFIRGRLKFGDGNSPAPFPSMIVVFRNMGGT